MFETGKWVAPMDACELLEDTIANVEVAVKRQSELLTLPLCISQRTYKTHLPCPYPFDATTIDMYAYSDQLVIDHVLMAGHCARPASISLFTVTFSGAMYAPACCFAGCTTYAHPQVNGRMPDRTRLSGNLHPAYSIMSSSRASWPPSSSRPSYHPRQLAHLQHPSTPSSPVCVPGAWNPPPRVSDTSPAPLPRRPGTSTIQATSMSQPPRSHRPHAQPTVHLLSTARLGTFVREAR